jgi:hypothetical protein
MFATEHFEAANVIAMFMGKKNAVQLLRTNAALLKP